jgi:hypothetical protein
MSELRGNEGRQLLQYMGSRRVHTGFTVQKT